MERGFKCLADGLVPNDIQNICRKDPDGKLQQNYEGPKQQEMERMDMYFME